MRVICNTIQFLCRILKENINKIINCFFFVISGETNLQNNVSLIGFDEVLKKIWLTDKKNEIIYES